MKQRFAALALVLSLMLGLTAEAGAASTPREVRAELGRDTYVTYNGEVQVMQDAAGNQLYPISCGGVTYLPVRAIGDMLGLEVGWDAASRTVLLDVPDSGWTAAGDSAGTIPAAGSRMEITAAVAFDTSVAYNGELQPLEDASGNPVYPLSYEGVTYLPVRAVCTMLGIDVDWDPVTKILILEGVERILPTGFEIDGEMVDVNYDAARPGAFRQELEELGFDQKEIGYHTQRMIRYLKENREDARTREVFLVSALFQGKEISFEIPVEEKTAGRTVEYEINGVWYDVEFDSENPDAFRKALLELGFPENRIDAEVQHRLDEERIIQASIRNSLETQDSQGSQSVRVINAAGGESGAGPEDTFAFALPRGDDPEKIRAFFQEKGFTDVEVTRGRPSSSPAFKTSTYAGLLGEAHIGTDYVEVDWSAAGDGYIRVRLNKQLVELTTCGVSCGSPGGTSRKYYLPEGEWVNLPLLGGSGEYQVSIQPYYNEDTLNSMTVEEADAVYRDPLQLRFGAGVDNPDAVWTLSSIDIDYENSPETCAKALELTKDCETDAEKITAVFEYVAKTIKYDQKLYKEIKAYNALLKAWEESETPFNPLTGRFRNGEREYLVLDDILASKSGVCEDYATLMAGMLRSLGIPCKYGRGEASSDPKNMEPHGWCLVRPETGELDKTKLGAGTDGEWIRLDPTWASTGGSAGRKAASNDKNYITESYY